MILTLGMLEGKIEQEGRINSEGVRSPPAPAPGPSPYTRRAGEVLPGEVLPGGRGDDCGHRLHILGSCLLERPSGWQAG